jgi:hypothetical protein
MDKSFMLLLVVLISAALAFAQAHKIEGRWTGTVEGFQGQQPASISFKKDGDKYTGTLSGLRPGAEVTLKDIKIDGDKVTARTDVESPQGTVVVAYAFVVQGDSLKGKGDVEFGGQNYTFSFDLRRGGEAASVQSGQQAQPPPRPQVPQPQQKQSINYFVGTWTFSWIGRESPLGPAPREGTTTYTLRPDGKSLDARTVGKSDNTPFNESAVITWDEETKMLTFSERLSNGIQVQSKGDWHSPISIRFTVDPIKRNGQTLQLRRTISVVAAHSFTITEELSENGGPFVRLGNAIYTKAAK